MWECPVHDEEHWVFAPCPAPETGTEEEIGQIQVELEPWDEKFRAECSQLRNIREQNGNLEEENPEEILSVPSAGHEPGQIEVENSQ